jgi:prolyl oligopeptidase
MTMTMFSCRAALLAAAATCTFAVQAEDTPVVAPPRAVPFTETVHGITLADEYRWMEDPANLDAMIAFIAQENARTRTMLDALPERAWFEQRLGEISSNLDRIGNYMRCGDVALLSRTGAGDRLAKLYLRDAQGERLFLDPAVVAGDELASFGAVEFAPDCRRVSVQVSSGGAEAGRVLLFDIASGKQIGQPVERIWGEFSTSFVGNDKILYTQMAAGPGANDPMLGMTSYIAPIEGGTPVQVLGNGMLVAPENFPFVVALEGEPFAIGIAAGARADNEFYIAPSSSLRSGTPAWRKVVSLEDKVGLAMPRGRELFVLSTKDNPAGTILRRPLAADGTPGAAETAFAGTPERLVRAFLVTRDGVYIHVTTDGAARLFFLPDGRGAANEIALPFEGSIYGLSPDADGGGISFALTGWAQGLTVFHAAGSKLTALGIGSQVWGGAQGMAAMRTEATSKDGTRVPMVVMRRKGATGRTPTIIEAYGGYGIDTVAPYYGRNEMAWLDKGGAFAFCGTRGGGERGRDWHEGGRGPNKPRGMEDLAACARQLTALGIAPAKGPLIIGGSMAGTLVPTAALSDPEAFGALITQVGIVNPTRIGAAENGANQFAEIGNPDDPQQFRDLVAMDAYQMIPSAAPPVPTMMVIGLNDRRVVPWMTAKWVARARAKWPDAPIYLRGDADAGHGIGSAEDVRRSEAADIYAFAWSQQSR